jgi:hypothetical protein
VEIMAALSYDEQQRRLRVSGECDDGDAPRISEAVLTLARPGETLIIDLTAVTGMTNKVARALLRAQGAAEGCRITLLRKSDGPVDRRLHDAGDCPRPPVRRAATRHVDAGAVLLRHG